MQTPLTWRLLFAFFFIACLNSGFLSAKDYDFVGAPPSFFDKDRLPVPKTISLTRKGVKADYVYVSELGGGGFSRVMRVYDPRTGTSHALSVSNPQTAKSTAYYKHPKMFDDPVFTAHQNVAQVELVERTEISIGGHYGFQFDQVILSPIYTPESKWMLSQKNKSQTATDLLKNLEISRRVREGSIRGLHALSNSKFRMAHRDVKPGNIVIDGDVEALIGGKAEAKIIDFGLATMIDAPRDESISGTGHYMAPELFNRSSEEVDLRLADLYSLGHTSYEAIFGIALMKDVFKVSTTLELINIMQNPESFKQLQEHVKKSFSEALSLIQQSTLSHDDRSRAFKLHYEEKEAVEGLLSLNPVDRIAVVAAENPSYAAELKASRWRIDPPHLPAPACTRSGQAISLLEATVIL